MQNGTASTRKLTTKPFILITVSTVMASCTLQRGLNDARMLRGRQRTASTPNPSARASLEAAAVVLEKVKCTEIIPIVDINLLIT